MNFLHQFRRTASPHSSPDMAAENNVESLDLELLERPLASPQSPANAYIAKTDAVGEKQHYPVASQSHCQEFNSEVPIFCENLRMRVEL